MAQTQISMEVTLGRPAKPARQFLSELGFPDPASPVVTEGDTRQALNVLWRMLQAMAAALLGGFLRLTVTEVEAYAARITLGVTQANIAVGEYIIVCIPGKGNFTLTAVAASPDVTLGQFVSETSNAVTATNMAAAVNGMLGLKDWVSATTSVGNLILVSTTPGAFGNTITVIDGTVNGISGEGNFSGGIEPYTPVEATVTISHAALTAGDTFTIGGTTLTWNTDMTIGADATADAVALAAAINDEGDLAGLVTATAASGVVTLKYRVPPHIATHIRLATSDAVAMVLVQPATNLAVETKGYGTYNCGG